MVKHEPEASTSPHFASVLKIPKYLYNSTLLEEQVFHFFYKMYRKICKTISARSTNVKTDNKENKKCA